MVNYSIPFYTNTSDNTHCFQAAMKMIFEHVNARVLNGRDGYAGHFVVVKGYDAGQLIINDPGLPAYENKFLTYANFMKAWAYPNKEALNLIAFRKQN
jgi:hypothetical protein